TTTTTDPLAGVRAAYEAAERIGSLDAWDAFLRSNPPGPYADFARAARQRLAPLQPPQNDKKVLIENQTANTTEIPRLKLRLTSSFPKSLEDDSDQFARRVKELSGGRLEIQAFAAGEIIPGFQAADAVTSRTVEMAWTSSSYYFGKD